MPTKRSKLAARSATSSSTSEREEQLPEFCEERPASDAQPAGAADPPALAAEPGGVKSAVRVFDILELFQRQQTPLRLTEIATHLGAPPSSTIGLLRSIAERGYLSVDPRTKTWFPTPRLAELGDWILAALFDHGRVRAMMTALRDETGELVMLGTPNDLHAEYVEVLRATRPLQYYLAPGTRRLLVQSGVGWALLSQETDATIERLYARTLARGETSAEALPLARLMQQITQLRQNGWAYSRHTVNRGAGALAMPLPTPPRLPRLALGLAGPIERLDSARDTLLAAMHRHIATLAAA